MIIYSNDTNIHIPEKTIIAIGKFDGVHYGHQEIFNEMRKISEETGYKIAVFTFCSFDGPQISTLNEKRMLFESEGADYLIEYPFTDDVRTTSGEEFLSNVLIDKLNMAYIVAGEDCTFGFNRSGNTELLNSLSDKYGYKVRILKKIKAEDADISSTLIKKYISSGELDKVFELKGSYYSLTGKVVHGNCLGSTIAFPTANMIPEEGKILPKPGVYATRTHISGITYDSMTNIGTNPTVSDDDNIKCETHIFEFDRELYNMVITIDFVEYIREEIKFKNIDCLIEQLKEDKRKTLKIFHNK